MTFTLCYTVGDDAGGKRVDRSGRPEGRGNEGSDS
jgi:hypothetical protein